MEDDTKNEDADGGDDGQPPPNPITEGGGEQGAGEGPGAQDGDGDGDLVGAKSELTVRIAEAGAELIPEGPHRENAIDGASAGGGGGDKSQRAGSTKEE